MGLRIPAILRPSLRPVGVSRRRKNVAVFIAGLADLLQIALFPMFAPGIASPLQVGTDIAVAVLLFMLCGFRWWFLVGVAAELVPVLALFPTWTLFVVAALPVASAEGSSSVTMPSGVSLPPVNVSSPDVITIRKPPVLKDDTPDKKMN